MRSIVRFTSPFASFLMLLPGSLLAQNNQPAAAQAHAQGAQGQKSAAGEKLESLSIPGVPNRPDLVTVIPFELYHGWVFFTAEVGGRRGRFIFDTGEPNLHLNRNYVKEGSSGMLDTVTEPVTGKLQKMFNVKTFRVGTITEQLKEGNPGPPTPRFATNANIQTYSKFNQFEGNGHAIMGLFGLAPMEPFETIIDYPNKRLVFIRLDSAGHRMVDVPAFKPTLTTALAPISNSSGTYWWGIVARLGDEVDTLEIDTGGPCSNLIEAKRTKHASHLSPAGQCTDLNGESLVAFDHIVVEGQTFNGVEFPNVDIDDSNDLNYPFLNQLGVVGFNFRTKQFMAYKH